MVLIFGARAVSNHEGGPRVPTSSFETHRTAGKYRLCDAPQDVVGTGSRGASANAAIATPDCLVSGRGVKKPTAL
jgi:hypothetical protein